MTEHLRATVATISRFHSFELAIQLEKRNALAAIYTGLARRFVRRYGVAPELLRTFPWIQTPLEIGQRLCPLPASVTRRLALMAHRALDRHVARTLPPCHVYVALAGIGLVSGKAAQAQNIAYACVRSSSHITVQNRLLLNEYAALGLPHEPIAAEFIERELAEYEQADGVIVPSRFAYDSFVKMGFPERRLFQVPFGVNLARFSRQQPRAPEFRVLFVGAPGVQKGLHYLLQAFARAALPGARLVIVGHKNPETDILLQRLPVPELEFVGPLPHAGVAREMSRASVLVLPSINDGFGAVLAEALACECPVIASRSTGGADLFTEGDAGFVVPTGDVDAIADRLVRLYENPALLEEMSRNALTCVKGVGGWDSYGDGMCDVFLTLAQARGHDVRLSGPAE